MPNIDIHQLPGIYSSIVPCFEKRTGWLTDRFIGHHKRLTECGATLSGLGKCLMVIRGRENHALKRSRPAVRRRFALLFGVALSFLYSEPSRSEDSWGGIRLFEADLSARHQTILTNSDGTGFAKVRFDLNAMEISWEVEYDNLESRPTGLSLHGPAQPGTNAVAIIDLGLNGLESPIAGSMKVSDAHVQYMLLGWTYVLLKTEKFDHGELRGKLDSVPPQGFKKAREKYGHVPKYQ